MRGVGTLDDMNVARRSHTPVPGDGNCGQLPRTCDEARQRKTDGGLGTIFTGAAGWTMDICAH